MARRAIALLVLLSGCAGSPIWYASHPDNKQVLINGVEYTVVPRAPSLYAVYRPHRMALGLGTDEVVVERAAHLEAVERVTRCKAIRAELTQISHAYLVTVQC